MFDLNLEIDKWRRNMSQLEGVCGVDVDELESHLHEEIEHLKKVGLAEQEAFWVHLFFGTHKAGHVSE